MSRLRFLIAGFLFITIFHASARATNIFHCKDDTGARLMTDNPRLCVSGSIEKHSQAETSIKDIKKQINTESPQKEPPTFINHNINIFENEKILSGRIKKDTFHEPLHILHIGDSHIQSGIMTDTVRQKLQSAFGNAGRGLIFPYALANTNSPSDYQSRKIGQWLSRSAIKSQSHLGIVGFSAQTTSLPARFSIQMKKAIPAGKKTITVFLKSQSPTLQLTLNNGGESQSRQISPSTHTLSAAKFTLEHDISSLQFEISNNNRQGDVEIHGINIENQQPGIVYHSLGVNGASLSSLSAMTYLENQFAILQPDIVVLDFGSNDLINSNNIIPEHYASLLIQTIQRLRTAKPNIAIILIPPQDMSFRGKNISAARQYAALLHDIALKNQCLLWDWYHIAGGQGAMKTWVTKGLASSDHVHLTSRGYQLKGQLLADAFLHALKTQSGH